MKRRSALVLALSAAVLATSRALHADGPGLTLCLFRALTRVPCPSCGLSRAFIAMAHGEPARAAALHPLGPGLFVCTCFVALTSAAELGTGRAWLTPLWQRGLAPFVAHGAAALASHWLGVLAFSSR